jgi:hypothetical protein
MSHNHLCDTDDYPIPPAKDSGEMNPGQVEKANAARMSETPRKKRMVEIGRGENTAARQTKGRG